jgi:hypothetical protein
VAEGVYSAATVLARARALGVEMPITEAVVEVLAGPLAPGEAILQRLMRARARARLRRRPAGRCGRCRRQAAARVAVLAPGLEHRHRHGVAEVQAALAGAHRQAHALRRREALAHGGGRPAVSLPKTSQSPACQRTSASGRVPRVVKAKQRAGRVARLRTARPEAWRRTARTRGSPARRGAAAVVHREAQRLHQVQRAAGVGRQPDHVAGVGRDLGCTRTMWNMAAQWAARRAPACAPAPTGRPAAPARSSAAAARSGGAGGHHVVDQRHVPALQAARRARIDHEGAAQVAQALGAAQLGLVRVSSGRSSSRPAGRPSARPSGAPAPRPGCSRARQPRGASGTGSTARAGRARPRSAWQSAAGQRAASFDAAIELEGGDQPVPGKAVVGHAQRAAEGRRVAQAFAAAGHGRTAAQCRSGRSAAGGAKRARQSPHRPLPWSQRRQTSHWLGRRHRAGATGWASAQYTAAHGRPRARAFRPPGRRRGAAAGERRLRAAPEAALAARRSGAAHGRAPALIKLQPRVVSTGGRGLGASRACWRAPTRGRCLRGVEAEAQAAAGGRTALVVAAALA